MGQRLKRVLIEDLILGKPQVSILHTPSHTKALGHSQMPAHLRAHAHALLHRAAAVSRSIPHPSISHNTLPHIPTVPHVLSVVASLPSWPSWASPPLLPPHLPSTWAVVRRLPSVAARAQRPSSRCRLSPATAWSFSGPTCAPCTQAQHSSSSSSTSGRSSRGRSGMVVAIDPVVKFQGKKNVFKNSENNRESIQRAPAVWETVPPFSERGDACRRGDQQYRPHQLSDDPFCCLSLSLSLSMSQRRLLAAG